MGRWGLGTHSADKLYPETCEHMDSFIQVCLHKLEWSWPKSGEEASLTGLLPASSAGSFPFASISALGPQQVLTCVLQNQEGSEHQSLAVVG